MLAEFFKGKVFSGNIVTIGDDSSYMSELPNREFSVVDKVKVDKKGGEMYVIVLFPEKELDLLDPNQLIACQIKTKRNVKRIVNKNVAAPTRRRKIQG